MDDQPERTSPAGQPGRPADRIPARRRLLRPRLRLTFDTGLQGKLVLCFCFLLAAALGASCWLFVTETRAAFDVMAADQVRQLSGRWRWPASRRSSGGTRPSSGRSGPS
jgi:hypothetical protein